MKNLWKWILGIAAILLVLGALIALPLVLRSQLGANLPPGLARQAWRMPMHDFDRLGPMMGPRQFEHFGAMSGLRRPGEFNPLFAGFMVLGGLLRLLVPLGIVALIAWLAYQQGKKAAIKAYPAAAPEPVGQPPAPEV